MVIKTRGRILEPLIKLIKDFRSKLERASDGLR
jgi:hypothetical protein